MIGGMSSTEGQDAKDDTQNPMTRGTIQKQKGAERQWSGAWHKHTHTSFADIEMWQGMWGLLEKSRLDEIAGLLGIAQQPGHHPKQEPTHSALTGMTDRGPP